MSKISKKEVPRRFGNSWVCPNCQGNPEFEQKAMMDHLQSVHQIDTKKTKGSKRDPEDAMMWGGGE